MKVIKFSAEWCPACLVMKPKWAEIIGEAPWLEVINYDFDADIEAVDKYQVSEVLPAFIFLDKDSQEIMRLVGEVSGDKILEAIIEHKNR